MTRTSPLATPLVALILAFASALAPATLFAQDSPPETEAPSEPPVRSDEPDPSANEGRNLWWVPGILGLVASAVSFAGYIDVRQDLDQRREERAHAERCNAAGRMGPECVGLGRLGMALLSAPTTMSVCEPEIAAELGITDICEDRDRDRRRQTAYLTVGTLGLLVGIGAFIAYALLERRGDEREGTTARLSPWLSVGDDRSAGLALDLTF